MYKFSNKPGYTEREAVNRPFIETSASETPTPKLPLEVWRAIAHYLDKNTYLLRVRRVCRAWREVGKELLAARGLDLDALLSQSYFLYCCSSKGRDLWERDLYVNRHYKLEQFTLYIQGLFFVFLFRFLFSMLETQQFLFRSHFKQWDDEGRSKEYFKHARGTYESRDAFREYSNRYDGFAEGDYYQELIHRGQEISLELGIDHVDSKQSPITIENIATSK
jgi:hypothetical protein